MKRAITLGFYCRVGGKHKAVKRDGKIYKENKHATSYEIRRGDDWENIGRDFKEAEIKFTNAQRREDDLAAGRPVKETPDEPASRIRIADVIRSYVGQISEIDKNGERRPEKTIKSKQSELERFHAWSGKTYVDELTRETLVTWRDKLNEKYEPDTVYNKLMTVTTCLKKNPLAPTKPLLPVTEFPDKKETMPDPYTEDEFNAMQRVASYDEGLLVYFFAVTGMRDQEVAHAKREDIDWELGELHIVKKLDLGFTGKTRAALRTIPLPDDLLAELRLKPEGLLFPAARGGVEQHYLRIIEKIAVEAGVKATTDKKHMKAEGMVKDDWCHRFRDTYITNSLYHTCASAADMLLLCARIGHGDTTTLKKYFGRLKKPYTPKLREKHGIALLRATGD